MVPSSILCRAQEAYHRDRASVAELDNVRIIATQAAVAWGNEAKVAERREARRLRVRAIASSREAELREGRDRTFIEISDCDLKGPDETAA